MGRSGNQSSVSMEQSGQSPVLRCSTVAVLPQGHGAAGGGPEEGHRDYPKGGKGGAPHLRRHVEELVLFSLE